MPCSSDLQLIFTSLGWGPMSPLFYKQGTEAEKGPVILKEILLLPQLPPHFLGLLGSLRTQAAPFIQSPQPHTPSRGWGLSQLQL